MTRTEEPAARLLPISAGRRAGVAALADGYRRALDSGAVRLPDLVRAATARAGAGRLRVAAAVADAEHARSWLGDAGARCPEDPGPVAGPLAFVLSGQGNQWTGLGRGLLEEATARDVFAECEEHIRRHGGWSLHEMITTGDGGSMFADPAVLQPYLVAVQVALVRTLAAFGITASAYVGHSLGEISAACAAGALTLDEAMRLATARGEFMRSAVGTGLTALLGMPAEAVAAEIGRRGAEVDVAAWNAPDATLVSGAASAVRGLVDDLSSAGTFARLLPGTIAFHSRFLGGLPERLTARVDDLRPLDVEPLLISTVTGETIAGSALTGEYWGRNLREPVRFQPAIERLAAAGYRTYVEVGAHPTLLPSITAVLGEGHRVVATLRRGEPERTALLTAAADLYEAGVDLNWPTINSVAPGPSTTSQPTLRFWSAVWTRSTADRAAVPAPEPAAETDLADLVQAAGDRPTRIALIRDFICDELSRVLRIGRDRVDADQSMTLLGLDSIMGLELRRRLSARLGADVRVATLLRGATPGEVAAEVTDVLAATSPCPATGPESPLGVPLDDPEELDRLLDGLDDLSPDEVESLLDRLDMKGLA